jgi:opacity protein-like surface antigen
LGWRLAQLNKDLDMRSLLKIAVAGAATFGVLATAHAADLGGPGLPPPPPMAHASKSIGSGWYLRGDVGAGHQVIGKFQQDDITAAGGTFIQKNNDKAFFAGVGVGYRANSWLRADITGELRGGGSFQAIDRTVFAPNPGLNSLTNTYRGNISSMVALFNGYVDLGTWNCITPFLGAGIGLARHTISGVTDQGIAELAGPVFVPTLGSAGSYTKTNMAWALMAGIGYEVNPNLTLEVGYRYLNMGSARSGALTNAFTGQVQGPLRAKDIDSHDIKIGMRWTFGDPNCCAPAAAPVAYAPAPAPMPMVRKY